MVRDPLYRSIEKRLGERLDPDLFERCAVELLRDAYPGLAPITGGDDGDRDGAIASGAGEPLPLVVTTSQRVLGNLTRNLKRYRRAGGSAIEAVLATSQELTGRKVSNLEKRVRELGFTLRNVHDQRDFTGRLYRNPMWRKELLGLTGDLPALSALPDKAGSRWKMRLVGRDREMDWLRRASGDVVVAGQPGVGKTALLEKLAREGGGLFPIVTRTRSATALTPRNMGRIADAYREQRPPRIFVDDAHLRDSLIERLARLRDEIGAEFAIVATTWPSHENEVRRELLCPRDHVLRVGGLDRGTAAKVVRQVHAGFSDDLVAEILNQSVDNMPGDDPRTAEYLMGGHVRPGLAVTLARYASLGDLADLATGELLLSAVRKDARLDGSQLDFLASFALGGSAGMRLAMAARALDTPATTVRQSLLRVSGTGIVRDVRGGAATIHPRHLRHALVKRTFFSGASSLALEPLIDRVEDAVACTETLIDVAGRAGRVLDHELREALDARIRTRLEDHERAGVGRSLWESYALTSEDAVGWILDQHPERTTSVSSTALRHAPSRFLGGLVSRALSNGDEADALTNAIRGWVLAGQPGKDAVERRASVVRELAERACSVNPGQTNLEAISELLAAAFSLSFQRWRGDPIEVTGFTIGLGSLPAPDVQEIADLWTLALPVFRSLEARGLSCARGVVHDWLIGPHILNELDETRVAAREEVRRMLPGILDLAGNEPGILLWAHRLARKHGLDVELPDIGDPALRRLFPDPLWPENRPDAVRDFRGESLPGDWPQERLDAIARDIAHEWLRGKPGEVVARMMHYERQRELMDHNYPNVLEHIPLHLAQRVDDPGSWLEELVDRDAQPGWVVPFLEAAVVSGAGDRAWEVVARDDRYMGPCVRVGLCVAGLPEPIVGRIMEQVNEDVLSHSIDWNGVARDWKDRLLRHPAPSVRGAVAGGMWEAHGGKRPGGPLGMAWEEAVLACGSTHMMFDLLRRDPGVGRAWILSEARRSSVRRGKRDSGRKWEATLEELKADVLRGLEEPSVDEELLTVATGSLDEESRRELIGAIPADANPKFFRHLVDDEPELYAVLLRRRAARKAHPAPLRCPHSFGREALVREAIKHGYSQRDIDGW